MATRSSNTNRQYEQKWQELVDYLADLEIAIEEATADDVIEFFRMKAIQLGKAFDAASYLFAIQANEVVHRGSLADDRLLRQVARGLSRQSQADREVLPERLPLPAAALEGYCRAMPPFITPRTWLRNRALLTLAFRAMRRPGEMGYFRRSHVSFVGSQLRLLIPKSKTDQLARGRTIVIDPTGNITCPVRALQTWLPFVSAADDWLFPDLLDSSKSVSSGAVNSLVKEVARLANLSGRYTGHSLRIGGATAALRGGLSVDQIRSIGDWRSDAILFYLRSIATAELGASQLMGL